MVADSGPEGLGSIDTPTRGPSWEGNGSLHPEAQAASAERASVCALTLLPCKSLSFRTNCLTALRWLAILPPLDGPALQ